MSAPTTRESMVSLRPASRADVALVARVLEMAGRGHLVRGPWDFLFPDPRERAVALARMAGEEPLSWCHHGLFHVAELDGRASAALCCFEAGTAGDASLGEPLFAAFTELAWAPPRIEEALAASAPFVECFPDMPPGTWIVENVGTLEEARRHGLVRDLLDRALAEGRARGLASAQISCLIGNDAAQRAYERVGFEVVEERRSVAFERVMGCPGFSRMTRGL